MLKLGKRAEMHALTVQRAESSDGEPPITRYQGAMIRAALEAAGVEFTNGDEPDVRLSAKGRRASEGGG